MTTAEVYLWAERLEVVLSPSADGRLRAELPGELTPEQAEPLFQELAAHKGRLLDWLDPDGIARRWLLQRLELGGAPVARVLADGLEPPYRLDRDALMAAAVALSVVEFLDDDQAPWWRIIRPDDTPPPSATRPGTHAPVLPITLVDRGLHPDGAGGLIRVQEDPTEVELLANVDRAVPVTSPATARTPKMRPGRESEPLSRPEWAWTDKGHLVALHQVKDKNSIIKIC